MMLFNPFSKPEPRTRQTENTTSTKQYAKRDGTYDERENDLDELCQDYVYYKAKAYKYGREGNAVEANEAQVAFQKVNIWLSAYNESDVTTVCSQYNTEENLTRFMQ